MNLILGAGLSGLSVSYHLGHEKCLLLERNMHAYGHLHAEFRDGFTWDQGPHVSFTKHDYVRNLFAESVGENGYEIHQVKTANYYKGSWINHPAQSSLYQIPEPLRSECLASFLSSRSENGPDEKKRDNYQEWLDEAFGPVFARTFPGAYTRKYWTRSPQDLSTDWVGARVFYPEIEDVIAGSKGPLDKETHYITKVRYPKKGGYQSFARILAEGARIRYGSEVCRIDLAEKKVWTADGICYPYSRLINTLPLPTFIALCVQASPETREAAAALSCSQLLLVNVTAPHPTLRSENWMYVYDEDKFSTRINCTELLSSANAPQGYTGVQTEVYFSRHKPLETSPATIAEMVKLELAEMGLIDADMLADGMVQHSLSYASWANVIFDHETKPALKIIWEWLEGYGLEREPAELQPLPDWINQEARPGGDLVMAGRFGQWKYYWTDDCVLRGKLIGGQ